MSDRFVIALDQGTTSTRAILFDQRGEVRARASRELTQIMPRAGWVEHDPEEIAAASIALIGEVLADLSPGEIAAIGISNQRETTVLWDRESGRPVHNAIVWQDRRTAAQCRALVDGGHEPMIAAKTGLLADPYFSATKIAWLLDHVEGARAGAEAGRLAFGTIDSWLVWRLSGGRVHASDETNASRTLLFDIATGRWDQDLLDLIGVPAALLPAVQGSMGDFGRTDADLFGASIPIRGIAGDQQAAAYGQACYRPGMIKATFGTGCFVLVTTGARQVESKNRLLTTIACGDGDPRSYALEGSVFMAGAIVQWLRDGLGIIGAAADTQALAQSADSRSGVYLVPAFQGLGAPYWDAEARGLICGLSRAAGRAEIVRAALESVAYQTRDLIEAARKDMESAGLAPPERLRIDGGMVANDWFVQFLADILDMPIDRARITETTALGAAYLAGRAVGLWHSEQELEGLWQADATFEPAMAESERSQRYAGWQEAVSRAASRRP